MTTVNPRIDIAFKKIFGVEENKDLLISLINAVLDPKDRVADVTLLNPYNPKNFRDAKLSIMDIKAMAADGRRFNVEIQISDEADYDKRALYYWAKLYTEQLRNGEDYALLSKAVGIHILNFTSILELKNYHNVFRVREQTSGLPYFTDFELHTVELDKFAGRAEGELQALAAKVRTSLDMWAAFLTRHDLLERRAALPRPLDTPDLKKALDVLEVMNFSDEERDAYEGHLKWLRIEANTLRKYENKGFEKGVEKGRELGREEGMEKGREERALEIARALRAKGMDAETVAAVTGLSPQTLAACFGDAGNTGGVA